ncbi:uncharacterized protein V1516DRAFT_186853 [Lipomyces oligophaga]|uniref:uncharacterized protein n=1 Tax=Lipomyces oligophaga TaxID=45792 RepID=UPI0034CEF9BC
MLVPQLDQSRLADMYAFLTAHLVTVLDKNSSTANVILSSAILLTVFYLSYLFLSNATRFVYSLVSLLFKLAFVAAVLFFLIPLFFDRKNSLDSSQSQSASLPTPPQLRPLSPSSPSTLSSATSPSSLPLAAGRLAGSALASVLSFIYR